jgi:hypothetical protein
MAATDGASGFAHLTVEPRRLKDAVLYRFTYRSTASGVCGCLWTIIEV